MRKIEVGFSPVFFNVYDSPNDSIVVIIDVLRATTAICTAFKFGVKEIIPVATIEEALSYKQKGYLVGAERNGLKLDGFDFGNSPYHYMGSNIKDQTIVLTTTNGTQAIETAKNAYKVVIGAFTNLSALCNWLAKQDKSVLLLCSGWKNKLNLEDSLFAGAVVNEITKLSEYDEISDSALCAKYLYNMAKEDPDRFLHHSSHRRRLAKLNLKQDIKYSLTLDLTDIIPILIDNKLVKMKI
ncbi:MAG: 2-phosphosulfolactate phosphatase [Flavobacteriales bacterium]|nr:2-phosphosulfolactate phosphatase [Flavobacteriales bacterium]